MNKLCLTLVFFRFCIILTETLISNKMLKKDVSEKGIEREDWVFERIWQIETYVTLLRIATPININLEKYKIKEMRIQGRN